MKRQKFVQEEPQGEGKCPGLWSPSRLEYKKCNMQRCQLQTGQTTLKCKKKLDVVLLIDGSGSLGHAGWDAEIKAAKVFISAFDESDSEAKMAAILYSGPRTWSGVKDCVRPIVRGKKKVSDKEHLEDVCKIKTISHLTDKMSDLSGTVGKLVWPQGSTMTTLALLAAKTELSLGREDAKSIVVTITDGKPLSPRATGWASNIVRKQARLLWVAVTKAAPRKLIKKWATRDSKENTIFIDNFDDLAKPERYVSNIIADICPTKR